MSYPFDRVLLTPGDIDLAYSPLAATLGAETFVLGAFNPGVRRLPNGRVDPRHVSCVK